MFIGAACAAVIALGVVLTVVLVGGSDGTSPKDTAEAFIQAAEDRDCDKALSLVSDHLKEQEDATCDNSSDFLPPSDSEIEFGEVKVSDETDSTATATVDATIGGQKLPVTMKLVKEDDDWKIDEFGG